MNELDTFLLRCHRYPGARTKLRDVQSHFLMSLTPAEQKLWPRKRLISELGHHFVVGRDSARVLIVGGLSLVAPPQFVAEGGRLRLTRV